MKKMGEDISTNLYFKGIGETWKPLKTTEETIIEEIEKALCNVEIDVNKSKITVSLPEKYIINSNAVILMWRDGSKTIVKKCKEDTFNARLGFLTAFFQHYTNLSKSKANKYLANLKLENDENHNPKHMKEEPEFKVGDRVEVIKKDDWSKKGWKGRITGIDMDDIIQFKVKYDNGEEWWIAKEQIKLIKEGK